MFCSRNFAGLSMFLLRCCHVFFESDEDVLICFGVSLSMSSSCERTFWLNS